MRFAPLLAVFIAPVALAKNIIVQVGANNTFAFSPTVIRPFPGDIITFEFLSRNHSATTTTFETPCPPPIGGVPGGFDTGFFDATTALVNTTIRIRDFRTHWVACAQAAGAHCRLGMVLAINPPPDKTFDQFLANSLAS